ncbi:hypothetical protein Tco_1049015 [Tanacetum coccineum]
MTSQSFRCKTHAHILTHISEEIKKVYIQSFRTISENQCLLQMLNDMEIRRRYIIKAFQIPTDMSINAKSEVVCAMCKQCFVTGNHDVCMLNYVNDMNSRADNQSANVSKLENQKKHKANVRKSKELGSQGSLASSRPSKPRNCLRWVPTGRIFAMCGKLTASSNTENKSDKSVCDNASTSNPSKPSSKGFSNSTSLLGRLSRLRKQHTSIYPIVVL